MNGEEVVYVPRTIEFTHDQPLGVEGRVVTVLHASRSSRRITVLVEESAKRHDDGDASETSEGIEVPGIDVSFGSLDETLDEMGYRDIQEVAGDLGIKANQSEDELIDAITEKINE